MEVDDFQSKTEAFLQWLSTVGIVMSPKILIADLRTESRGRGVVATENIAEDEVIFSIPRSAVLNVHTALKSPWSAALKEQLLDMPPWLALTTVLLVESQNLSNWEPYLAILPSKLDSLVFWSQEELSVLQASAVVEKIGRLNAEEMFTKSIAPLRLENESMEMCHRVASVIMAYAFDIPDKITNDNSVEEDNDEDDLVSDNGESTTLTMIPLADLLNADADRNNARLCCDHENLEMRATRSIATGEEVFNDYGALPRADLLRRYGYVTPNYSPYDVVEISAETLISVFRSNQPKQLGSLKLVQLPANELENRVELAVREGVYEDSYDLAHPSPDGPSIPDELLAMVYILVLDNDNFAAMKTSHTALPSRSKLATKLVGQVLTVALHIREAEYQTTLEEDEVLLQATNVINRTAMAIQVRHGEKAVLKKALREAAAFSGSNKRMRLQENAKPSHVSQGKNTNEKGLGLRSNGRFRPY